MVPPNFLYYTMSFFFLIVHFNLLIKGIELRAGEMVQCVRSQAGGWLSITYIQVAVHTRNPST